MNRLFISVLFVSLGLFASCVDKNMEVDEDTKPEWLGGSIYEELKNPNQSYLTGTFTTYLRLVDDLGYTSTLSRTGSKTVFPANDEAFARFFKSNAWGVTSYGLTVAGTEEALALFFNDRQRPIGEHALQCLRRISVCGERPGYEASDQCECHRLYHPPLWSYRCRATTTGGPSTMPLALTS